MSWLERASCTSSAEDNWEDLPWPRLGVGCGYGCADAGVNAGSDDGGASDRSELEWGGKRGALGEGSWLLPWVSLFNVPTEGGSIDGRCTALAWYGAGGGTGSPIGGIGGAGGPEFSLQGHTGRIASRNCAASDAEAKLT